MTSNFSGKVPDPNTAWFSPKFFLEQRPESVGVGISVFRHAPLKGVSNRFLPNGLPGITNNSSLVGFQNSEQTSTGTR
jgi:hypothetical protein